MDSNITTTVNEKVMSDINILSEQINLCIEMLRKGVKIDSNHEALRCVIGFLEACVPRMADLIEDATLGMLNESTFKKCLSVNDRLLKVLSICEKCSNSFKETSTPAFINEMFKIDNTHNTKVHQRINSIEATCLSISWFNTRINVINNINQITNAFDFGTVYDFNKIDENPPKYRHDAYHSHNQNLTYVRDKIFKDVQSLNKKMKIVILLQPSVNINMAICCADVK